MVKFKDKFQIKGIKGSELSSSDRKILFSSAIGPYFKFLTNDNSRDKSEYFLIGQIPDKEFGKKLRVVNKLSFVIMILNSIQASVLPLYLSAFLPQNFYNTLRIFGLFVFGEMPLWDEQTELE